MLHYIFMYCYNMSGRVVLDIQTEAEGKKLYVWYNMAANIVKDFWYEWM